MSTDTFGRKRQAPGQRQAARTGAPVNADEMTIIPAWMKHVLLVGGVVGFVALTWTSSGETTTAAEHCSRGIVGHDSCALKPTESVITCGWLKCGGLFSSASESTRSRLDREERLQRSEAKHQREQLRREQIMRGELSGDNRRAVGNRFEE